MNETPVFNGVAVRPLGADRDVMDKAARPAVFDGKRLVRVSTCPLHPKYQAKRAPRGDGPRVPCPGCRAIWRYVESLADDEPVVML